MYHGAVVTLPALRAVLRSGVASARVSPTPRSSPLQPATRDARGAVDGRVVKTHGVSWNFLSSHKKHNEQGTLPGGRNPRSPGTLCRYPLAVLSAPPKAAFPFCCNFSSCACATLTCSCRIGVPLRTAMSQRAACLQVGRAARRRHAQAAPPRRNAGGLRHPRLACHGRHHADIGFFL